MGGLSLPSGDPALLRQLAAQLDNAAVGVGNLSVSTRQVSESVRSGAAWEGSAADGFSSFTGDLSQGTSAVEGPLTRIALAVRDYAGYLETAQQRVADYATLAEAAQVSGNDAGYVSAAEAAGQAAQNAVVQQQAAGERAAAAVSAAEGQLKDVFGQQGPVQTWLDRQPMPWDSLAATAEPPWTGTETDPVPPELGTGTEIYPLPPELGTGTEIFPVEPGLPTSIIDPLPPELGTGTETYPVGPLGPLINYDKGGNEGAGGQGDAEPGSQDGPQHPDDITGYTNHGQQQAEGRDGGAGVAEGAINDAVKNPIQVVTQGEGGSTTYKFIGQNATVVLNPAGKVITTWANNHTGRRN